MGISLAALLRWCASVRAKTLPMAELCKVHQTDKCNDRHGYVAVYDLLFAPARFQDVRLLEIGILDGQSLRLWEAYFPNSKIFGLDIANKSEHDSDRIKTIVGDQGKREDLENAISVTGGGLDVIIDDGGHTMMQQQLTLGVLFPALKSGGIYIIEDVHTSFPDLYAGYGVERAGANSTYAMIDHFMQSGRIKSEYLTDIDAEYLTQHISRCLYFFRSSTRHSSFFACWKK